MKLLAASVAACMLAVVAAGVSAQTPSAPAPTPFVLGTFQPSGTNGSPSLPTIGGTKALRPACAVMRDVVVPSFSAALRADARFELTRKKLPQYVDVVDDPEHKDDAYAQMMLKKIDDDVDVLLDQALAVNRALGDPMLEQHKSDPQVAAEKRALEDLYEAQRTRANLMEEYVIRERAALAKQGVSDDGAFGGRGNPLATAVTPPPMSMPNLKPAPGMPFHNGIALADRASISDWGTTITKYVHTSEERAAKTFYTIANGCRR